MTGRDDKSRRSAVEIEMLLDEILACLDPFTVSPPGAAIAEKVRQARAFLRGLSTPSSIEELDYARVLLTCARADWYRPPYSQLKQDIDKFLDTPRDGGRVEPQQPAKSCSEGVEAGSAVSAIEPKINPAILPALPGQKPITVCMFKDDGPEQADAAIEAMKRGDTFMLPQGVSEMFFNQLRLRAALDPSLADKIAVYYLRPDKREWCEVPFAKMEDQFRWPTGFMQDGWEKEMQISAVRGHANASERAKEMAAALRAKYGTSDDGAEKP